MGSRLPQPCDKAGETEESGAPTSAIFTELKGTLNSSPHFGTVAIIGAGLLGGSLGLAIRSRNLALRVVCIDRDAKTLEIALKRGAADSVSDRLEEVGSADLIALATPVGDIPGLLESLRKYASPEAILTDLGSVKSRIVETGERVFGDRFLGGHPMAGSEESGILAARGDLFKGASWVFCRETEFNPVSDPVANRLGRFVEALGSKPVFKPAKLHDHLVSLISHLPHVLSYAYAETVDNDPFATEAKEIAAGSYRDLSRTSQSDRTLWNGIFAENRVSLLKSICEMQARLEALKSEIEAAEIDP